MARTASTSGASGTTRLCSARRRRHRSESRCTGDTCKTLGLKLRSDRTAAALALDAVTHCWADRRFTLESLAELLGRAIASA
jgi:hypothetical protein